MTIIWCMVPETSRITGRIFCHFGQFFTRLPPNIKKIKIKKKWKQHLEIISFSNLYHKWQPYDVWFLRYQAQQTEYFVILNHFLPFYSPPPKKKNNILKNKILKKQKKNTWRYDHFTQMNQKSWSYTTPFLRYNAR